MHCAEGAARVCPRGLGMRAIGMSARFGCRLQMSERIIFSARPRCSESIEKARSRAKWRPFPRQGKGFAVWLERVLGAGART